MNESIKRLKAWAHYKKLALKESENANCECDECSICDYKLFASDIEQLVEAVESAKETIEFYNSPSFYDSEETPAIAWLQKFSPNETSEE